MAQAFSKRHLRYGVALRDIRSERGLSQERLALLSGIDRSYYSSLERGQRNPTLETLLKIADALGVELSEIAVRAESGSGG